MNQILYNKITSHESKEKSSKQMAFKLLFFGSSFLLFVIISSYLLNLQLLNSKDNTSQVIANNYNILRLYNTSLDGQVYNKNGQTFTVIGMIEIPKINIYYPIISESNDEFLKISPCRISGPMPNEDGNLCIAGHNYDNYKFFSKVSSLTNDDEIIIYNMNGYKFIYKVYSIYEVSANDLSPLNDDSKIKKQVTLVTCNNFNSNTRIIIKASSI